MKNNNSTLNPVCILTAGCGTRMGPLASIINKSLLPYKGKALISHIINEFPKDTPFIIAVGYQAEQVINYIENSHPNLNVQYVQVDKYEGIGSGPGYSLWCCKHLLNKPFYFVACDTYFSNNLQINLDCNWIGVKKVPSSEQPNYCNVLVNETKIYEIIDKKAREVENCLAFSGFMYIYNYDLFWKSLSQNEHINNEKQISTGLKGLIANSTLHAISINWLDLGDYSKYRQAVEDSEAYDFSKTNEFLYFVNNRVIKFFSDAKIVAQRVAKASLNPNVFPKISYSKNNWYSYEYIKGQTLYVHNNPNLFKKLLTYLEENLWVPAANVKMQHMQQLCQDFYQTKTLARIADYQKKYSTDKCVSIVNGRHIESTDKILKDIPWDELNLGVATFMHGDLQFDNIIYDNDTDKFCLLDWRQDFAGEISYGDIYYDLAKLLGGIIVNYDYIKAGLCQVEFKNNEINFDFPQRFNGIYYINIFKNFVKQKDLDYKRIVLLVGLIYLNMAPLHHPPFDKALHALGRTILHDALYRENISILHSMQIFTDEVTC